MGYLFNTFLTLLKCRFKGHGLGNRKWYECDINFNGGYRGAERIVFSNDGLIYYTEDHYESFKKIY
jgi:hypothetical protein